MAAACILGVSDDESSIFLSFLTGRDDASSILLSFLTDRDDESSILLTVPDGKDANQPRGATKPQREPGLARSPKRATVYHANTHSGRANRRSRSSGRRIRPFCSRIGTELPANLEAETRFLRAKTNIRNENS